MSCYIVQEIDGTSRFTLEDGSGFLVLEDCIPVPPGGVAITAGGIRPYRNGPRVRRGEVEDEDELIAVVLLSSEA